MIKILTFKGWIVNFDKDFKDWVVNFDKVFKDCIVNFDNVFKDWIVNFYIFEIFKYIWQPDSRLPTITRSRFGTSHEGFSPS